MSSAREPHRKAWSRTTTEADTKHRSSARGDNDEVAPRTYPCAVPALGHARGLWLQGERQQQRPDPRAQRDSRRQRDQPDAGQRSPNRERAGVPAGDAIHGGERRRARIQGERQRRRVQRDRHHAEPERRGLHVRRLRPGFRRGRWAVRGHGFCDAHLRQFSTPRRPRSPT